MTPVMIRNQSLLMMTNKERMLVKSVAQEVKRSGLCSPYANQLQETSLVMLDQLYQKLWTSDPHSLRLFLLEDGVEHAVNLQHVVGSAKVA